MNRNGSNTKSRRLRCAIYTRKSTEEGLDQEFNSLDAQRESGEAYILSQIEQGWDCLPARYDDGGFTGGNMDRPALKCLLADIEARQVDIVVVYKVDRLSRSLLDFTKIMETFERFGVSFVSVTQQFNTTTSMGRLMLNVLLSFAQFEREIISERTRDKMAAARRKGKYVGGSPVLGYDLDRGSSRLVVNHREAALVRQIFETYLRLESLLETVKEITSQGWTTKRWTTSKGIVRGGRPFDRNSLYKLLTNVVYLGKVRYHDEVYKGEHEAIVDEKLFNNVEKTLKNNYRNGGSLVRNKYGALLKGLLRCAPCGCSMMHSYAAKGQKRYRYYVCMYAQKRGWHTCPSKSVPAAEMENFVVEQIRSVGLDAAILTETVNAARQHAQKRLAAIAEERAAIEKDYELKTSLLRHIASKPNPDVGLLADLHEQIRACERRVTTIRAEEVRLKANLFTEGDVAEALRDFDSVWESLNTREKVRILQLLIEYVAYDGAEGTITVTFRENGISALQNGMLNEDRPS
jgi:site-specific DNA recombinase